MSRERGVPRGVEMLVRHVVPGEYAEELLADLYDEAAMRVARGWPRWAVAAWCWGQALRPQTATLGRVVRRQSKRRDMKSSGWTRRREGGMRLDDWGSAVRHAVRVLRREPGFSLAAIALLAMGIGVNTAIFSALRAAVLRPVPYPAAERLVLPQVAWTPPESTDTTLIVWSWPKYDIYRRVLEPLTDGIAGYAVRSVSLTRPGDPTRLAAELVEADYFDLVGGEPLLGRTFSRSETGVPSRTGVVVIGHALWSGRLGSDPDVLGRSIELQGQAFTVVGVMPEGFQGITGLARLWLPMGHGIELVRPSYAEAINSHWMHVLARRRGDVSFEDFRSRSWEAGDEIFETHGALEPGERMGADVLALQDVLVNPGARSSAWILTGAAALLLLIAVANLAALYLARSNGRRRDAAIRLALGSGSGRLVRGVVLESLLLAGAGGLLSFVFASWGTALLRVAWPENFRRAAYGQLEVVRLEAMGVDGSVLLFAGLLTVGTGVLFGLLPAIRHGRSDPVGALSSHVGSGPARRTLPGGRATLVGVQSALAMVLLVSAGLMTRTLHGLRTVEHGFRQGGLLTFRYSLPTDGAFGETPNAFHQAFLGRLRSLPAVEGATVATVPPYAGGHNFITSVLEIDGEPYTGATGSRIGIQIVDPSFFDVLGVDVLRGRGLTTGDREGASPVVVLSRTAVSDVLGEEFAVGSSLATGLGGEPAEVVGVVADVQYEPPVQGRMAVAYYALPQFAERDVAVVLRVSGEATNVLPEVRRVLAELDPALPIDDVSTVAELARTSVGDTRILTGLLASFALLALLLASTGLYGVVAYTMSSRRRELGLRMALGASRGRVHGMVLRQGLAPAGLGVGVGLLGAGVGTRLLESFLYDLGPRDPLTFLVAAVGIMGVAALASWLPTRRVTGLDPTEALKTD